VSAELTQLLAAVLIHAQFQTVCIKRFEQTPISGDGLFLFRAAWNASTDYSDEKAVCQSVCLSVKGVDCDKTEEKSVQICPDFYTIRKII